METIYKDQYNHDGEFINLEYSKQDLEELICNYNVHFDKCKKYYIYCHGGLKSYALCSILKKYNYCVVQVINRY